MKRADLQALEGLMMKEVVKRRALGGYSAEAEGVLHLCETMLRVLQHMIETYPEPQPRMKKNAVPKGDI
jgi:hypothetical protein